MAKKSTEKYDKVIIDGKEDVEIAMIILTDLSCWFEVTPMPESMWEVKFKNEPHIRKALQTAVIRICGNA